MTVEELIQQYNAGRCVQLAETLETHPATIRVMMATLRKMGYPVAKPHRAGRTTCSDEVLKGKIRRQRRAVAEAPIKDWWKARGF